MPIGRPDKLKDAPAHGNSAVSDPYLYGFPNPPTTVNRIALASAIDRMCLVDGPFVQLCFRTGKLTVMTTDEESSETLITEGDDVDLKVSYQAKLLSDSLGAINTEMASISVNPEKGIDSRLLLRTTDDDGWKAVVMPIKN